MQREGSAFQGLGVVMLKELSDHLTSVRMRVLEWLIVLVALAALYGAIQQIKDTTAEDPFLFLRLFTTSRDPLPSFVSFLSFLVPLMAIGLAKLVGIALPKNFVHQNQLPQITLAFFNVDGLRQFRRQLFRV